MAPFVVLGGGPCGLSAAWTLAQQGERVVVIEQEPLVGGLCATHEQQGYRFDLGGHRFVSGDLALTRWLESLLGDELLTRQRRSVVLHEGRRFHYPLEARDLLQNLGLRENARALLGYAVARARQELHPRPDVTFEDWVTTRFGRPLYDAFFGPYTAKLWGIAPHRISADWAAERISLLHLGDALRRLLPGGAAPIRTYAREYRYPRLGMGQLYDVIAKDIVRLGGEVRTGATVSRLETSGGRVTAAWIRSSEGETRIPTVGIVSTIPLPELVAHLSARAPSAPARALRFRSLVFLNLLLDIPSVSDSTWMYVASGRFRVSRIQEPNKRSPFMAPVGKTSLMLEIPCDEGDALWTATVPALRDMGLAELRDLGVVTGPVKGAFSVRVRHGYPIYHLGYERDRQALLGEVARFSNVRTAGRQGLFRYVFMDAAMQMGALAAEQLRAGLGSPRHIDAIGRSARVVETTALTA